MARLMKTFSVLMMVLLLSSVVQPQSRQFVWGKDVLKGLKSVNVIVVNRSPDIEKDGLKTSSIQTDVELKLRMAGIKVLTEEETQKEPGKPYLVVRVNSFKEEEKRLYFYNIEVQLIEVVCLERDTKMICNAATWSTIGNGSVDIPEVASLRDITQNYVDKFINAYLAVNKNECKSKNRKYYHSRSVTYILSNLLPKKMTFKDMLSRGKGTEYIIESIDFDVTIPGHMLIKVRL
ncbi:hypothetical protein ACFL1R_13125 [Candidatus Latescibacterota bacterium]